VLGQIRCQAVECPGRKGEAQALRGSERGLHDGGDLLRGVRRGAPFAAPILQPGQSTLVEAVQPQVHRRGGDREARRNRLHSLALHRRPHHAGPFDQPRRCRAGVRQPL
jgi:hypothetical protein